MGARNSKVDAYFDSSERWIEESAKLRAICLDCQLTEELKWRQPCYTFEGGNVVIIQGFKEYCALMFFKGALLKDANGILVAPGNNTQAGRQARFTSVQEVVEAEPTLKAYIREAIEVAKSGLRIEFKETSEYEVPDELQTRLDADPALRAAFDALTPGRQRAYLLHFSAPKRSETRASRVERCIPAILDGKGLNDRK